MRAEQLLPDHTNQVVLDGTTVRKGTVGAFLVNARVWLDPNANDAARAEAEADLRDALSAMRALGVFDVFEIRDEALRDWIAKH